MARSTKNRNGLESSQEGAASAARAEEANDAPAGKAGASIFEIDFDPEGWMSERPRYWLDRGPSMAPSRLASLRRRLREAASALGAPRLDARPQSRTTEEEWIRLSEQALGPLPRPSDVLQADAARERRLVPPDAARASLETGARVGEFDPPKPADGTD